MAPSLHQLDRRRRAHLEPLRHSSCRTTLRSCPDNPLAKVLRQGGRHRDLCSTTNPLEADLAIPFKSEPLYFKRLRAPTVTYVYWQTLKVFDIKGTAPSVIEVLANQSTVTIMRRGLRAEQARAFEHFGREAA